MLRTASKPMRHMQVKPDCVSWSAIRSCAEQCGVMRRAVWGHDLGHTDTYIHTHTNKEPWAGVQLVVHTSIILCLVTSSRDQDLQINYIIICLL